ncbi:Aminopeptidase C [Fructilactobacillus florum 8D]|uniref:Aminopeptidase n=2 Tax=Fructilactobacillus florum TaxID=640331 RepID=W9EHQ9_9LACO|nr:C1 family peptidase [Fructilactobacillus florum]ETO40520.1 Aminopeptidase C [Fructilactobacillus florum 8D]KRM91294.1 aminopeptidase [Fructilactobacillus florum DSM 22689 = JCM 16035]
MTEFNHPLTPDVIQSLQAQLHARPDYRMITNAVAKNGIKQAAYNAQVPAKLNRTFSIELPTGKVANQKKSGRCWLFSILNTLRHQFAAQYHFKDFELSESYLFFWDKLERANIFYDRMIALANQPVHDREVSYYLDNPGSDGGQWAMAAALIEKYGVVPRETFPETANTENTAALEQLLNRTLRSDALKLRNLIQQQASDEQLNQAKTAALATVYRMVSESLGEPPAQFDFEYRDDQHQYQLDQGLTPIQFYQKYFSNDLDQYVVLSNDPSKPMQQKFALPSQNNVVGGREIEFINLPMSKLKQAAIKQLQAGISVWFGNDVLQQSDRQAGLLDRDLYQEAQLFGLEPQLTKAERFSMHDAEVSHAMTLTGVDLQKGQPVKWKVENSWGDQVGVKGYFVMADNWMDEFTYEVVVKRDYLDATDQLVLEQPAQTLLPWDPLA